MREAGTGFESGGSWRSCSLASSVMSRGLAEDCGAAGWERVGTQAGRRFQELCGTGQVSIHLSDLELAESRGEMAERTSPPLDDGVEDQEALAESSSLFCSAGDRKGPRAFVLHARQVLCH